jgi:phage gp29-like protein
VAKGPDQTRHRDSPVSIAFRTVDNKEQIDAVLRAHDYGIFSQSATLVDEMMTDDRIQGVTEKRQDALISCDVEFQAASDKPKAKMVRDLIGGTGDAQGLWRRMMPPADIKNLLSWGWFLCAGFGENVWSYDKGLDLHLPRLKWWHPTHARWDWTERAFILQTQDAWQVKLPDLTEHPRGDGKWVQWMPNGGQYGWRRGLIRSLAHKYVVRQWNDVDWARFNERHGTPVLKAMVPSVSGNEEEERGFFERLADLGAETAIVLPQGDTPGTSYDAAWIELQGRNWESFQALKKDLGDEIAIAVLGQNLTTQVDGGSFAAATVHEGVELKKLAADAEIASALSEQLLSWFCHHNFGDANLAPRMVFKVVPEKDEAAEVSKDEGVTRVILGAQSVGLSLDVRAYAEKHGLPLTEEDPDDAQDAEFQEEADEEDASNEDEKQEAEAALGLAMKRYAFAGLPVAVENPVGTKRRWQDADGTTGETLMRFDYGFIEGHLSGDGEELDCYVGPDENATRVYVVHQLKAPTFKAWDEDKVMLGFESEADARRAYLMHRSDGDRALGSMSSVPLDAFKRKLKKRTGTGKIRASVAACGHAHTAALAAGGNRKPKTTADHPAVRYQTALERTGKAKLAKTIAVDVAAVQRVIASSKSFDEVSAKLTTLYKNTLDPASLAKLVERANILAKLNGRLGAVEDL